MSKETSHNQEQEQAAGKKLTVEDLENVVGGVGTISAGTKSKILVGGVGNYSEGE